eukprot:jgi/Botrbrau1/11183/Bobra.0214s0009.1
MAELADQNAIIEKFSELRREAQELSGRVSELSGDLQEHELVIKNLEPVDRDRRCYRLVGDVLVERTVRDVLPIVIDTAGQLKKAVAHLRKELVAKRTELMEFQAKYKIRVKGEDFEPGPQGKSSEGGSAPQGMLVAKK